MHVNKEIKFKQLYKAVMAAYGSLVLFMPAITSAQTPSSTNYQVPESSFTSGSNIDANSASFNARVSFGDLAVGTADSTNYSVVAGSITPDQEYLELVVQTSDVDLGALTPSTTGVGSGIFYVRSYINEDYVVYSSGSTLTTTDGNDTIEAMLAAGGSTTGTEQFGLNLVDNTSPNVGADPAPDPSTTFANGEAATGYDTADQFKFVDDEIIARSGTTGPAWGRTNFTISYIANISSITEAGTYIMEHDIIVTVTY